MIKKEGKKYKCIVEVGGSGKNRKRKCKRFSKFADARQWEMDMKAVARDIDIDGFNITVRQLADQWLDHKKEIDIAKSTFAKYDNAVRKISQFDFYTKKAREVKMPEIEKALHSLAKDYSKSYIVDIKSTLSAIFTFGIDQDYLIKNPCQRAALPKHTAKGRDIDSYTEQEVALIESHRDDVPFGDVVYVMLNTGLRTQEVCCLDIDDVSIIDDQPYLTVSKALTRVGSGWELSNTKTKSSERTLPIKPEVYKIIVERCMRSRQNRFIDGNNGGYISYTNFREKTEQFFSAIHMRYLPPHCLRHTYASRCEWSGIRASITKELMGHTTEDMTARYTHIMNKNKIEAVANMR